ncbi:MAG: cbb3-type cytochrome c oxidase subunit I [Rickettsiales bacterium]|jgi:hypothetical protein|nr:cbb3-type cytochrome c oxidase subunit I [Rickettsiales bacterium]
MLDLLLPKDKLSRCVFIAWFILAVMALAASGIYSFLPYALRTPFLAKYIDLKHLFNVSLMVHVNLGVLIWFMSCSAMLMIIVTKESYIPISLVAFLSSVVGAIFIATSPFIGASEAIKSDYIPILHNLVFIIGISLFITGILLQAILTSLSYKKIKDNLVSFTIYMNAMIFLIVVICFVQSVCGINKVVGARFIDLVEYYQLLFWGPGHLLQFCYIQLIIIVWMVIAKTLTSKLSLDNTIFIYLQWFNFLLVAISIMVYWFYPIDSAQLYDFFTLHMKYIGGLLATIIAIWLLARMRINISKFEAVTLFSSIFLLLSGGFIGYLITGANVTVPAHYHGVILGITVGLMGLFYMILPKVGFRSVNNKHAIWQIMIYTVGQFIHVAALAISGGYGVLRKAPGTELSVKAKMFMGAMGVGGSLALIGGVLFVVLIFRNMKEDK